MPDHDKYVTTSDFNKCLNTIFDQRLKQGNYNNVEQHAVKDEQKIEQLKAIDFLYS